MATGLSFSRLCLLVTICCGALWAHAAPVELRTGLDKATGIAVDDTGTTVYFVESGTGTLHRLDITPGCNAVSPVCPTTALVTTLGAPQDVALDAAQNVAYVTSFDPLLNGALWRVDLATNAQKLITFNFGKPRQIALDAPTNTAYITGSDPSNAGRIWKVNLSTGAKKTVISGLKSPSGLVISANRAYAYVTESTDGTVAEIDIALGLRIRDVSAGLGAPTSLAWTDAAQTALYAVERLNTSVTPIDVLTATKAPSLTGLGAPLNPPFSIAVNSFAGVAYVTTDDKVLRVELKTIDLSNPVFISVGNIVVSDIDSDGYSTSPAFKDAPFGGTLNIFGNLSKFKQLGATHYGVNVSFNGSSPPDPVKNVWTGYKWNFATKKWDATPVGPDPGTPYYQIPIEYPAAPERWSPPFLMLQWPSGVYGTYEFTVELFTLSGTTYTNITPAVISGEKLVLKVDNDPPKVDLTNIFRRDTGELVGPCAIVNGPGPSAGYDLQFTASDSHGHMRSYSITAYWGKDKFKAVMPAVSYVPNPAKQWQGVTGAKEPSGGFMPACNCAHTFALTASKRTTNGLSYLINGTSRQSITINDTGITSCQ